jgi:hypothetical protein
MTVSLSSLQDIARAPETTNSNTRLSGSARNSLRSCLLHFGLHKTGSSSIQNFLSSHTLPGILYPDLGEANQSRPLATAFRSDATEYHLNRKAGLDPSTVEQRRNKTRLCLDNAFASLERRRMVLSAEDLSLLPEDDLADFVAFLAQQAGAIKGLAYVRAVSGWLESLFQETLRNSSRLPPLTRFRPLYRPRLEKFDRLLSPPNVELVAYQKERLTGGCVVQDFARRLGVEPPATPPRANTGLSLPAVRLLAVYRQWRPSPCKSGLEMLRKNKLLALCLRALPGPPLRFSASLVERFIRRTRADIDWAEERLGHPLSEISDCDFAIERREDLLQLQRPELDWLSEQCGIASARLSANAPDRVAQAVELMIKRHHRRSWFSRLRLSRLFRA